MLEDLKPTARSLATAWLAHTNPDKVNMPTDIDPTIARAFYLGIECGLSGDADSAEDHYRVLQQDADLWAHAGQAGLYIQSLHGLADATHGASNKAAKTISDQRQLERITLEVDALRLRMDRI